MAEVGDRNKSKNQVGASQETSTNHGSSDQNLDKNQKRSKKMHPSSRQILSSAYSKSMREEEREEQSLCCPVTLRSIHLFVVLLSIIFFARAYLAYYSSSIEDQISRRYSIDDRLLGFMLGVEKIGFIITLIFTGYYGRNAHKPLAIFCGALLCCVGAVLLWIPCHIAEPRESAFNGTWERYVEAGLCQNGRNQSLTSHNQCNQILVSPDQSLAYSLMCTGKFLIGLGTALFITLGIIYLDEGSEDTTLPRHIGILLCMDGLGELVASLLSWLFTSYSEDVKGKLHFVEWDVGAWWAGLPIAAALFFFPSVLLLFFPKWIETPRWLAQRRRRRLHRLEVALAKIDAERREKKRKKRKKRQQETRNRAASNGAATGPQSGETAAENEMAIHEENHVNEKVEDDGLEDEEDEVEIPREGNAAAEIGASDESLIYLDDLPAQTTPTPEVIPTIEAAPEEATPTQEATPTRKMKKQVMIQDDKPTREEFNERPLPKNSEVIGKRSSGTKLGRQLRDLPANLNYLLKKPEYPLVVIGCGLALYFPYAFHVVLPDLLQVQFLRADPSHRVLTGICHGIGSAFGALLGGLILFKLKLPPGVRQITMVIGCLSATIFLLLPLLAMRCDIIQADPLFVEDFSDDKLSISSCNSLCDCSHIEEAPVCANMKGVIVKYPTACHAGCRQFSFNDNNKGFVTYHDCLCSLGYPVSASFCKVSCSTETLFNVIYTLATAAQSTAFTAVILFFLRYVSTKLRSLSLGFGVWLSTLIVLPGVTIFKAIAGTACLSQVKNCDSEEECWQYDTNDYRYSTVGAVAGFQFGALCAFFMAWLLLRHHEKSSAEEAADIENGSTNVAYESDSNSISAHL